MQVYFKKCDGKVDWLECVRQDGSSTRCPMPKQGILPHDLVHYVVESTLALRHGFYRLIAAGVGFPTSAPPWDADQFQIEDLTEALQAESLVECFQAEMWNGFQPSENFLEILEVTCQQRQVASPAQVTEENVQRVRSQLQHFTQTWDALSVGQTLAVHATWLHERSNV
ncbi:hypothetical protein C7293_22990 [filamentous cyanobacterium CCT1]|nr:hypothetical protein C7293_22990 [filamentous cyanobacterium CCT1]PSN78161.1 hypothetical protein C8B47_18315 [filamentous cyanobacterium CCP4]